MMMVMMMMMMMKDDADVTRHDAAPGTWHDDQNVFIKSRRHRDVTRMTYWRHASRRTRMRRRI